MNDILTTIVAHKMEEVAARKKINPQHYWEAQPYFEKQTISLKATLQHQAGIIAEYKRKSPSKGVINAEHTVEGTTKGYEKAGAVAVSVLTDEVFFGGSSEDFLKARQILTLPMLRKDFIIDPYQVYETKGLGADIMLLIAACLTPETCNELAEIAKKIGLEVLLEVHNSEELHSHLNPLVDFVGVNNRNLKTFAVDLNTSVTLATEIPATYIKISESGLQTAQDLRLLQNLGYKGFLIGESFMKTSAPAKALQELWQETIMKTKTNPHHKHAKF
ncbi:MAG: indole-3-glycerol phosphate synthase TrpC [Cytophagales bacterium]|nr:MAG: indole-3-glycerol phosphate synthase TrpC [Cytophagales bacterium]